MNFKLYQIYFDPKQLPGLDPDMLPYDNSQGTKPDAYEFYVFQQEYLQRKIDPSAFTGYVSWKFQQKTGMSGKHFLEFCKANPGYDVYFVNPYPNKFLSGNVWQAGEIAHPGLVELAQHLLEKAGHHVHLLNLPASLRTTSFCNYWVGNKKFWDGYMKFCLPVWDYIFKRISAAERKKLFSKRDVRTGSTYFAFIFERLFTTYILTHPEIRVLGYRWSEAELSRNFSPYETVLINEIQKTEAAFPEEHEPIKNNPLLMSALHYYNLSHRNPRAKDLAYILARSIWHRIPFRLQLMRMAGVRKIYWRAVNSTSR